MDIDPIQMLRIRDLMVNTELKSVEKNADGLMNDVLIVNGERVFRFAKNEPWMRNCLRKEIGVLKVVRQYVRMPVPLFDMEGEDFVSYRLLPGRGLARADLYRQPEAAQNSLAQTLAEFLAQLHGIPIEVLEQARIGPNNCVDSPEEYRRLYEDLEREVLVHADSHIRRIVREHFEPLLQGWLDMSYEPCLIHGDLGQRHILFDPTERRITGVLDWGIAGLSDPAHDYSVIINCFGEGFLRRMGRIDAGIEGLLERARFLSGISEASWILHWVRTGDPFWLTPGLGTARDLLPFGCKWS